MDDQRAWAFEESLWTGPPENYAEKIDPECLMAVPAAPFVLGGEEAVAAMQSTPRWDGVRFENGRIARPAEGLIVLAYSAIAEREGAPAYRAHCTSVYRQIDHAVWRVIQHAQVVERVASAGTQGD